MTKTSDTPKMNVAVYARVSTDRQDNDNQLEQLREFAAKQGWITVVEFVDTVTSSGKKTRPQFEAMMLAASQRKFDLLLFWKLDRLSREGVRKTLVHLTRLDSYGVAWRSFMEPFFDSCGIMRDVVISIMAMLAELERIAISERTKAGLQRAKRAGRTLGRRAMEVDIAKVNRLRAEGFGLRAITRGRLPIGRTSKVPGLCALRSYVAFSFLSDRWRAQRKRKSRKL